MAFTSPDFTQPFEGSDVVFRLEDDRLLHFDKKLLSRYSSVFAKMFRGKFKESSSSEVPLPKKKFDDMQELFRCLWLFPQKRLDASNMAIIMPLADEYDIPNLYARADEFYLLKLKFEEQKGLKLLARTPVDRPKLPSEVVLPSLVDALKFGLRGSAERYLPYALALPLDDLRRYRSSLPVNAYRCLVKKHEHFVKSTSITNTNVTDGKGLAVKSQGGNHVYTSSVSCKSCGKTRPLADSAKTITLEQLRCDCIPKGVDFGQLLDALMPRSSK